MGSVIDAHDRPIDRAGRSDAIRLRSGPSLMQNFPLGDEYFLINHDDLSGRPLIRRDVLSCGLVVALLAELIMENRVAVQDGRVTALDDAAHGDEAGDFVITSLSTQRSAYTVRTWADNLDETAYELVARRLVDRGTVRRVHPRGLLRSRKDVFPTARREAAQPLLLLNEVINDPAGADPQRAVLVTLVATAGGEHTLPGGLDRDRIRAATTLLAAGLSAGLTALVAGFEEAINARLLSIRR